LDILEKPKELNEDEISSALGKLLWGEQGGKFSIRRLILNLIKKRLRGKDR